MIFVTRAILVLDGCILAAQRPLTMSLPLKWELPGGKLEENENPIDCVMREANEEFGLRIRVKDTLEPVVHYFRDKNYRMLPFLCEVVSGEVTVHEHAQAKWVPFSKAMELDWAPSEAKILGKWLGIPEAVTEKSAKQFA